MTWSEGFLRQATSDFDAYKVLSVRKDLPRCHCLHFLQMTVEKLAKSMLCCGSNTEPRGTHAVVKAFLSSCAANKSLRERFKMEHQEFNSMLRKLRRVADYIEKLAPALSANVNAEYPWKQENGNVIPPCNHTFNEVTAGELAQFVYFVGRLLKIQDENAG